MVLSVQGNKALSKIWDRYRIAFVKHNPASNLNDVERAFLYHVLGGITMLNGYIESYSPEEREIEDLIENIR